MALSKVELLFLPVRLVHSRRLKALVKLPRRESIKAKMQNRKVLMHLG